MTCRLSSVMGLAMMKSTTELSAGPEGPVLP